MFVLNIVCVIVNKICIIILLSWCNLLLNCPIFSFFFIILFGRSLKFLFFISARKYVSSGLIYARKGRLFRPDFFELFFSGLFSFQSENICKKKKFDWPRPGIEPRSSSQQPIAQTTVLRSLHLYHREFYIRAKKINIL